MSRIDAETATGPVAFDAEPGRKLVLAIEDAGIDILHRCGGNAKCTTCRVEIIAGDPGEIGDADILAVARSCLEFGNGVGVAHLILTAQRWRPES